MEIAMGSNLFFQMLLYYHSYFDFLYLILLIPSGIYKISISKGPWPIVTLVLTVLFGLTEIPRIKFGFRGNINESFPELIAFVIMTLLFSMGFVVAPMFAKFKFPHEDCLYIINFVFLFLEFLVGFTMFLKFNKTQSAVFKRRTVPIMDKNFKRKYDTDHRVAGVPKRELQIGLKKYNKDLDH